MSATVDRARPRIEYVDGLRAVAVLAVLACHIAAHAPHLSGPLYHAVLEGSHGVDLFFVLSGFCLAYPTLQKWRTQTTSEFRVADFASKRLVRIIPPFYLATFAFLAVEIALRVAGHGSGTSLPPPLDLAKSLLFLDERVQLLNPSFWTLMVEFRWYFLFPILLAVWLKAPRAFFCVGAASVILYAFTRARGLDFGTLPGFMLGIVAADIQVGARLRGKIAAAVKSFALPLAVLCGAAGFAVESGARIPGFDGNDVIWAYQPTILGWQLAAFFFVVGAGTLRWLRSILSMPALLATGLASYAIYLVHEPIVDVVVHKVGGPIGFTVAALTALAAGFTFWALAERPFTTGSMRAPLLERIRPIVAGCFSILGLHGSISLHRTDDAQIQTDAVAVSEYREPLAQPAVYEAAAPS